MYPARHPIAKKTIAVMMVSFFTVEARDSEIETGYREWSWSLGSSTGGRPLASPFRREFYHNPGPTIARHQAERLFDRRQVLGWQFPRRRSNRCLLTVRVWSTTATERCPAHTKGTSSGGAAWGVVDYGTINTVCRRSLSTLAPTVYVFPKDKNVELDAPAGFAVQSPDDTRYADRRQSRLSP